MTKKDLFFTICILLWLISNFVAAIYYDSVHISNAVCIVLFSILTLFKLVNKKFGNWLETKL